MHQHLQLSTDIFIYQQVELLCHTHNKLTRQGKAILHKLLTTTASINKIALSYTEGGITEDTTMFPDAQLYDITNTYFTTSSATGQLIMNFEANIPSPTIGQVLYRLGLAVGDTTLFTVASAGGVGVGGNPLTVLYQIRIAITEEA
jgi:hypothetical protein